MSSLLLASVALLQFLSYFLKILREVTLNSALNCQASKLKWTTNPNFKSSPIAQ